MIRKYYILLFLVCLPVLSYSQSDSSIFGLGGAGGISLITSEWDTRPTYQVSVFWDKYISLQDRFIRLQYDLGTWAAERKKNESFGYQEFNWRLYHLSASVHFLMGTDYLLFSFGFGTSLLCVHETEITRYLMDENLSDEVDKLKTSAVSFGLFPDIGIIIPISSVAEISFNLRYDFVMHPVYASRFSVLAGLFFLLI